MEKNNGKIVAIVALIVAVVALSVGFAAFADTLTITGTATATSNGNAFDATASTDLRYQDGSAKCFLTGGSEDTPITGANIGSLSEDDWTGISVPLGSSANDVTCKATVVNNSQYKAFLTRLYSNAGLSCSSSGANATANANAVCAATTVTVTLGTNASDYITITNAAANLTPGNGFIAAGGSTTVTVRIVYTGATVDQDVTITLPTISHLYSSVSNSGS